MIVAVIVNPSIRARSVTIVSETNRNTSVCLVKAGAQENGGPR